MAWGRDTSRSRPRRSPSPSGEGARHRESQAVPYPSEQSEPHERRAHDLDGPVERQRLRPTLNGVVDRPEAMEVPRRGDHEQAEHECADVRPDPQDDRRRASEEPDARRPAGEGRDREARPLSGRDHRLALRQMAPTRSREEDRVQDPAEEDDRSDARAHVRILPLRGPRGKPPWVCPCPTRYVRKTKRSSCSTPCNVRRSAPRRRGSSGAPAPSITGAIPRRISSRRPWSANWPTRSPPPTSQMFWPAAAATIRSWTAPASPWTNESAAAGTEGRSRWVNTQQGVS